MPTLREKEDINFWNILFSISYAVLLGASLWHLYYIHGAVPVSISLFDASIVTLAAFRLTRLMVYDKIMRFFRELFMQKREIQTEKGVMIELMPYPRGARRTVYELLQCPWCTGVWAALFIVDLYSIFVWGWFIVFVFAVAGAATLVQLIANRIGWQAELDKLAAKAQDNTCG